MIEAIYNNRLGLHDAGGLVLQPGLNKLDTQEKIDKWEKIKTTNQAVVDSFKPSKHFKDGMLQLKSVEGEIIEPEPVVIEQIPVDVQRPKDVAKKLEDVKTKGVAPEKKAADSDPDKAPVSDHVSPKKARKDKLAELEACNDIDKLVEWFDTETDTTVKSAINKKVEKLDSDNG